jgi:CheY-like chemotaxis protein
MSAETPELGVSAAPQILVIEDNPDGRETLRTLLVSEGFHVDVAANGLEGLDKALASHPDIAIVDIGLPLLDGYQVARRLRSLFGRKIFLIACTGYGRPEDRRRSREAGFDVHLVKPIDLDELTHGFSKADDSNLRATK